MNIYTLHHTVPGRAGMVLAFPTFDEAYAAASALAMHLNLDPGTETLEGARPVAWHGGRQHIELQQAWAVQDTLPTHAVDYRIGRKSGFALAWSRHDAEMAARHLMVGREIQQAFFSEWRGKGSNRITILALPRI
jgi:hypothetical protein